jgi:nitrogen regulatory protein PII
MAVTTNQLFKFKIIDQLGRVVKSGQTNDGNIFISEIVTGIYTVYLTNENEQFSERFIKI